MGKNIVQKVLEQHLVSGEMRAGEPIAIRIDQTLTQDATGTMAFLQFEAMGVPKVKTELSVSYVDHNMLMDGYENADDHLYLMTVAAKYGVLYSKAGNGICHQVHLERFGKPGKTLLGSDSHTPTGGGLGMFSVGAGGLDVAAAMAGIPFSITCPGVIGVRLEGRLPPWVSSMDVILKVLSILTTKGNVGKVLEYFGPGIKTLTVPQRATITNMGAEVGVTTSVFPSDDVTKIFFKGQSREDDWTELSADSDATYDEEITINLSELEPLAAKPHSPDNVETVSNLQKECIAVNQVAIGSCTNSFYTNLMMAAKVLDGKQVAPGVSFIVAPGSKQVLQMISDDGGLSKLVSAGARIVESGCGFCIGQGQAPPSDGVSVRTINRNFVGRSGTKSAKVYLASVETAAASALNGVITDPRTLEMAHPKIEQPKQFTINDNMIFQPSEKPEEIIVRRGPNIGEPPVSEVLSDNINVRVAIKVEDKISTDIIMPAGALLKYRSNVPFYSNFVFKPADENFAQRCRDNKNNGFGSVIIAGWSYGQGSSREHAALCPMHLGVKAVFAKSMERIHKANLINFGILPLLFADESDYEKLDLDDELEIANVRQILSTGKNAVEAKNISKGVVFTTNVDLTPRDRDILLAGGYLNFIRQSQK